MADEELDLSEIDLMINGFYAGDDDGDGDDGDGGTENFPDDFKEYMDKELNWLPWKRRQKVGGWVFWGREDDESERRPQTLPENILDLEEKIIDVLHWIMKNWFVFPILVQFWAPITNEGRSFLTTQKQPFALVPSYEPLNDIAGLCGYRMICKDFKFYMDLDGENSEEDLGLPGRVFKHQWPEFTSNVEYYSIKEYPQRDHALRCGVRQSLAFPVFEPSTQRCLGVFEVVASVSSTRYSCLISCYYFSRPIYEDFEDAGLKFSIAFKHRDTQLDMDKNEARSTIALDEIKVVLEMVCEVHDLPLAQAWVPCRVGRACRALDGGILGVSCQYNKFDCYYDFRWVNYVHHLKKGVGVVGRALLSANVIFCRDVTQLRLTEYPLAHYAQKAGLSGCFAICLQSSGTGNDVYVLEFFMPVSNTTSENPHTLLRKILETIRINFPNFRAASGELWEQLHIEDIGFQNGKKLDSVQMPQTLISLPQSEPLQSGGEITQVVSSNQQVKAINIGSNVVGTKGNNIDVTCTQEKDTVKMSKRKGDKTRVVQMPQTTISLPRLEPLHSEGEIMQVDSLYQQLKNAKNNESIVVNTEHNNIAITCTQEKATGIVKKSKREGNKSGVKIKIPIEDILQASEMRIEDAAKNLKVSKSTLKRVCRDYGIDRWPPRKMNKAGLSRFNESAPWVNFDNLPFTQASATIVHIEPRDTTMQDGNMVTIKAKYGEVNAIKFRLSLSSGLVELQQEVAKRLKLEAGTYCINYRDEVGDLILIACDEDLRGYICDSRSLGKTPIVVFLEPMLPITY